MTYLALNAVFVLAAALVALAAHLARRLDRRTWAAMGSALIIVVALTAVFDNVMIAAGLFTYAPERILGLKLGVAPIEDFGYPVAAAILLPSLWALLQRKREPADD
jgi:lycopene cyclase domain-containing protein